MKSQPLVAYIEKIRYGRNISQEKLLEGIVSIRQYRRYLYGEVEIPFSVLAQLASRMNISPDKLFIEFEEEKNSIRRMILSFYNSVSSLDIESAQKWYDKIGDEKILDGEQKLIFESATANFRYLCKDIDKSEMLRIQKRIVDYPNVLNNKIFTDSEMVVLGTIFDSSEEEHLEILERFEKIFLREDFHISGDNAAPMIQIVFWLGKYYGRKKNYKKTIQYCKFGIKQNKMLKTFYLMEYFNYFLALSYLRLGEMEKYKESVYETILYLELIPEKNRVDRFYKIIKKDLDIEPMVFLRDFIEEHKLE